MPTSNIQLVVRAIIPLVSDNRFFGMYRANTSPHNKEEIQRSMQDLDGIVQIVLAMVALGMCVNMVGVNNIWHYSAPSSLEDYYKKVDEAVVLVSRQS